MRYLKTFYALNESAQDAEDILDFLANSQEGADLVLLNNDPRYTTFATMFETTRTGRVYCKGFGSKTYIDKSGGFYRWQTLSNSKIFAQEDYPTLAECVRKLWSLVASKSLSRFGVKKSVLRSWVETNIPVGSGLTPKDIIQRYSIDAGRSLPDLEKLSNSSVMNLLRAIFNARFEKDPRNPNDYQLSVYLSRPFGLNPCDSRDVPHSDFGMPVSFRIRKDLSGKNKAKSNGTFLGEIIIGDESTMMEYFDRVMSKALVEIVKSPNTGYILGLKTGVGHLTSACQDLINIVESVFNQEKLQSSDSSINSLLINALENLRKQKRIISFTSVIKALQASGRFPEVVDKFYDENEGLIKGGSVLKRFGFSDED